MLSGYEIEFANEIHRERLCRAEQSRLQLMAEAVTTTRTKKWSINARHAINHLCLAWAGLFVNRLMT